MIAGAFFVAWAWITKSLTARHRSAGPCVLLCVSLFLGFLYYEASVALFVVCTESVLVDTTNLVALLTHILGIFWNVSTILVALQWRDGRLGRAKVLVLTLLATLACTVLAACVLLTWCDPAGQSRTLSDAAAHPLGRVYAATYAAFMLIAQVLVVGIVIPHIRHVRSAVMRSELILVVGGSLLIACYASMRLVVGHHYLFETPLTGGELVPFAAHVAGALMYVSGIALVGLVTTAALLARGIYRHRLLLPMCRSGLIVFPAVGMEPTLRARGCLSTDLVDTQLLSAIVLLLDVEVLLSRTGERPTRIVNPHDDPSSTPSASTPSAGNAYREELCRLLAVARGFREIRKGELGQDWTVERVEEALRTAFAHQPHVSDATPFI